MVDASPSYTGFRDRPAAAPAPSYTSFRDVPATSYTSFADLAPCASARAPKAPAPARSAAPAARAVPKAPAPAPAPAPPAPEAPAPPLPPMPWERAPAPAPREEVAFSLFPGAARRRSRSPEPTLSERFAEWRSRKFPGDDPPPGCRGGRDGPTLSERFEAWSLRQGFASPPPPPPPPPRSPPRTYDRGPSHYAVLGVAATATAADVRRAYRKLALAHHPDRHARDPGAATAAAAAMAKINEAYGVLSDPRRRGLYDVERRVGAVR